MSSGHSGRVTSMHAGLGSLVCVSFAQLGWRVLTFFFFKVTASSDGDIRVLAPTRKPTLINLLKVTVKIWWKETISFLCHLNLSISEPRLWRGCPGLVQREESDPGCRLQQQHCEDLGCQAIVVDNCSFGLSPQSQAIVVDNYSGTCCLIITDLFSAGSV